MPRTAAPAPALAGGDAPVTRLPGVGPAVAAKLAERGIQTLQDLWFLLPLRYEDRTRLTPIIDLRPGPALQAEGRVRHVERLFRGRPMLKVTLADDSGALLQLRFFHFRSQQVQAFQAGRRVRVFGEVRPGQGGWEIIHPSYRVLGDEEGAGLSDRLDPVYPVVEGLGPGSTAKLVRLALDQLPPSEALELVPMAAWTGLALPGLRDALLTVHRPPVEADVAALMSGTHPAQQRLAFEELLAHGLSLRRQRIALREHGAHRLPPARKAVDALRGTLPFALTGAQQRVLSEVERVPHQLVMTATPIPRTLAMTAYADLDLSVIDELPPGRTPVTTVAVAAERRPELVERVRKACGEGRQAYWVCPLIEDSEEIEAQAAQTTYEQLSEALPELRVALLHGRMKPAEKQDTMRRFKAGELQLLVATTVIEVGVDVPNASLMLIENAERLGLAQLHQLRGRVGRGSAASSCVLLYQSPLGVIARERLDVMRRSNDGFVIAEKDLELRGPGELLGTRQTGLAAFRIADLARDARLLPQVAALAEQLLADSPAIAEAVIARWVGSAARYASA